MARSARDKPKQEQPDKPAQPVVARRALADRMVVHTTSNVPVRTVIYMEVGALPADQVRAAIAHVKAIHGEGAHPTFVIPVRDGKLTGDVAFESEILDMVNKVCEVSRDGTIVLRGGAREVDVMRATL